MSEKINANQDNDRQITLVDDQGNEELFEILFTFTSEDYGKSYVYYIQQPLATMMMWKYRLLATMLTKTVM